MPSDSIPLTKRIYFKVCTTRDWYNIIREAQALYGSSWQGQRHVKRKLERMRWQGNQSLSVWFDVPEERFATWISVKHGISATVDPNK